MTTIKELREGLEPWIPQWLAAVDRVAANEADLVLVNVGAFIGDEYGPDMMLDALALAYKMGVPVTFAPDPAAARAEAPGRPKRAVIYTRGDDGPIAPITETDP